MVAETHLDILIHPLVLLNISDYYTRVRIRQSSSSPRLAGICLGSQDDRRVSVETSFEVLLTNEQQIDMAFLEAKIDQYKQVFPNLDIMAWFTIGSTPSEWELSLQSFLSSRFDNPLLLMLNPTDLDRRDDRNASDLPIHIFESQTTVVSNTQDGEATSRQEFVPIAWKLETGEAERIAVDHISRAAVDHDQTGDLTGSEAALISHHTAQANAVKVLSSRLGLLKAYVEDVRQGRVAADQAILRQIQALVQRLPVMQHEAFRQESEEEEANVMLTEHLSSIMESSRALGELIETYATATPRAARGAARAAVVR